MKRFDTGFIPASETINYSGVAASGEKRIAIPRIKVSEIMIHGRYKLTDVDIDALEDIQGYINTVKFEGIKNGQTVTIAEIKQNEMHEFVKLLSGTDGTGKLRDGLTVSTEDEYFYFTLVLPHDFSQYDSCWMSWSSNTATSEWGGCNATFEIEIGLILKIGNAPLSVTARRFTSPSSSTQHQTTAVPDDEVVVATYFEHPDQEVEACFWTIDGGRANPAYVGKIPARAGAYAYAEHIKTSLADPFLHYLYPGSFYSGVKKFLTVQFDVATTITTGWIFTVKE